MKTFLKIIFYAIVSFLWFSCFLVILFAFINPPVTAFIHSRSIDSVFLFQNNYKQEWKRIDEVSPYFPLAVIASEDQRFFQHNGFDFEQIEKALDEMERGRRVRGASTISQQVAKNLFLWDDKSFIRKGIEAYYTVLIELIWTKRRILEVYINTAELGKNIYGVDAASDYYFNKPSSKLNKAEAALIAVSLPSPAKRNPANPTSYMLRRSSTIQKQMNLIGGTQLLKDNL